MTESRDTQIRWIIRLLAVMLGVAVFPVIVGILLDWRLHSAPIVTLAMMLLGFSLGVIVMYRQVAAVYAVYAPPVPERGKSVGDGEGKVKPAEKRAELQPSRPAHPKEESRPGGDSC